MGCGASRAETENLDRSSSDHRNGRSGADQGGRSARRPTTPKFSNPKSALRVEVSGLIGQPSGQGSVRPQGVERPTPPEEFTFAQVKDMTDNFSANRVLGEGGFGKVYQGEWVLPDGETRQVAVKNLNQEGLQGFKEWLTEVIFLRQLSHPNLVPLLGYCDADDQSLLVYEYMPNGSLDQHLFHTKPGSQILTWAQRVNVALGTARCLAYLHHGAERQVIFRDLKSANILLDENFNAKLSDFGLARDGPMGNRTHVSTAVVGTDGYAAPEYVQTGHLTSSSDVYSFGVVLLELLTGRRAQDSQRPLAERNLAYWALPFLEDNTRVQEIMDPELGGSYPLKAAKRVATSAGWCLRYAKERPAMDQMVVVLTKVQEMSAASDELERSESSPQP